jgi:hypothetical protein
MWGDFSSRGGVWYIYLQSLPFNPWSVLHCKIAKLCIKIYIRFYVWWWTNKSTNIQSLLITIKFNLYCFDLLDCILYFLWVQFIDIMGRLPLHGSTCDVMYCRQRLHLYYGGENLKYYLTPFPEFFLPRREALTTNSNRTQSDHKGKGGGRRSR